MSPNQNTEGNSSTNEMVAAKLKEENAQEGPTEEQQTRVEEEGKGRESKQQETLRLKVGHAFRLACTLSMQFCANLGDSCPS